MMRKNIEKCSPKYALVSDCGYHFGTIFVNLSYGSAFCLRPVFRNLWGVPPWTDLGLPCGTLGPSFWIFWKIPLALFCKSQRFQSNKWHQPHLQKNSTYSKKLYRQSTQTNYFNFCCLTTPRMSEAPGLKK